MNSEMSGVDIYFHNSCKWTVIKMLLSSDCDLLVLLNKNTSCTFDYQQLGTRAAAGVSNSPAAPGTKPHKPVLISSASTEPIASLSRQLIRMSPKIT
jgi:hypothetical protein